VVIIGLDNRERALAAHDTAEYATALKALNNGADRDIRIVEGAP